MATWNEIAVLVLVKTILSGAVPPSVVVPPPFKLGVCDAHSGVAGDFVGDWGWWRRQITKRRLQH